MIAILILNWNGYKDTIACLESLFKMNFHDFFIVIGDNGSTDNSIQYIKQWCDKRNISCALYDKDEEIKEFKKVLLYDMKSNHGFSKGNNCMLKFAKSLNPEYYFLLNNDTEVESDFLEKLLFFSYNNPQYVILTPQIRYYYDKSLIWNCGGNIFFGFRKYHYVQQHFMKIKEKYHIDCSYITGCAMLFKKEILSYDGNLFTEKFFFGEEDFELGLRMKANNKKMACVLNSIIYHKVGTSTKETNSLKRSYIHYLNRYIDVKQHFYKFKFMIWQPFFFLYMILGLRKEGHSFIYSCKIIKYLVNESRRISEVSKDYFLRVWNSNFKIE